MSRWAAIAITVVFTTLLHAQEKTEFSRANALTILHHLSVDIGSRVMGSPGDQEALQYAVDKFKEYGCDSAYVMPMLTSTRANTTSGIAVGIKKGTSGRIICLGGHIDSAGPEIPGADDDGSGTATVIELAHVLAKSKHQSTIVFCCFSGEEQGLEGSKYFVDHFPQLDSITLMLQADMANGTEIIDIDPDTHNASAPEWLTRAAIEEYYKLGYSNLRYPTHFFAVNYGMPQGSGSDHESFLEKGIPAVDFSSDVSRPIHTPRDNFYNFESAGLQRTGDLFLKLVDRFDRGVPPGRTTNYWLFLVGSTPLFFPVAVLWALDLLSMILGASALIVLFRRRPSIEPALRIRWSRLKLFIYSAILVGFAWFSPDLISFVQGVRHPWITNEQYYLLYAVFAFFMGSWVTANLSRKYRITSNAFSLFLPGLVILACYTGLLGLLGAKASVYPALGILFVSLAVLVEQPSLKFVFSILAPLPLLRLLFPEWHLMLMRITAFGLPGGASYWFWVNGGFVVFFTLCLLPFTYTIAAVVRDTRAFGSLGSFLRSNSLLGLWLIPFLAMTLILIKRPAYDRLWFKDLRINEKVDMTQHIQSVTLRSSEFLKGVHVVREGADSLITSRNTSMTIPNHSSLDTTWFQVTRDETKSQSGDTTLYNINLKLRSKFRPYTITLTYDGGKIAPRGFSSSWFYLTKDNTNTFRWGAFPDTNIAVPVKFAVIGADTLHETISVSFDSLAYPFQLLAEKSYVIPRTEYVNEKTYRK